MGNARGTDANLLHVVAGAGRARRPWRNGTRASRARARCRTAALGEGAKQIMPLLGGASKNGRCPV
eukprot:825916-Lingulodinium_polyedra.AAC.1